MTTSKAGQIKPGTLELLKGRKLRISTYDAHEHGTNIRTAMRIQPANTRLYILAQLERALMLVDAGATMQSQEEKQIAVDSLIELFPCFTVEEFGLVFKEIYQGVHKLYNRLKLAEIMDACRDFEERRARDILERKHQPERDMYERSSSAQPLRKFLALTEEDLKAIERLQK